MTLLPRKSKFNVFDPSAWLTPPELQPPSQMTPLLEDVGRRGPNIWILQSDLTFPWLWEGSYVELTNGPTGLYDPGWETRNRF